MAPSPIRLKRTLAALSISVLALALAASAVAAPPSSRPSPAPTPVPSPGRASPSPLTVGVAPPSLAADRVSGPDPADLTQLSGRVVILDFWATWCTPCRAIMPVLDHLDSQYRGRGLSIVGISTESRSTIERHLRQSPVSYTIARDQGATSTRFGVHSVPTLVVVARNGKVREIYVGVNRQRMEQLIAMIPTLLDEPVP